MSAELISERMASARPNVIEDELVGLLSDIGVPRSSALILVALHIKGELTSREMQSVCGLRQPQISTAMKSLVGEGKVVCDAKKNEGRGRPSHKYHLSQTFSEVIDTYIEDAERRLRIMESHISRLHLVAKGLAA